MLAPTLELKTEIFLALGARVVSVEPQPALAREIAARGSHYSGRCKVVESGVGSRPGTASLYLGDFTGHASLLRDWTKNHHQISITVTTLDLLIAEYGAPSFIKLDIEGSEPNAIRGLSHRIDTITLEYSCTHDQGQLAIECVTLLRKLGNMRINATSCENNILLFSRWKTDSEFLSDFPACVDLSPYGDLIIKFS
jgi:FkbM family methyltransferase